MREVPSVLGRFNARSDGLDPELPQRVEQQRRPPAVGQQVDLFDARGLADHADRLAQVADRVGGRLRRFRVGSQQAARRRRRDPADQALRG